MSSFDHRVNENTHVALDPKSTKIVSNPVFQQESNDLEVNDSNLMEIRSNNYTKNENTNYRQISEQTESTKLTLPTKDHQENLFHDDNQQTSPASTNEVHVQIQAVDNHLHRLQNLDHNKKEEKTNTLLHSITEQLQQNMDTLKQLETKINSSQKDTEEKILRKNDSLLNKLEQSVAEIQSQYLGDSTTLQSTVTNIHGFIESMLDQFKIENEKLVEKQLELKNLHVSVV